MHSWFKSTSSNLKGRLLIYIFNQFLFDAFVFIVCDSLSSDICAYRTNQTSPEGFLFKSEISFDAHRYTEKMGLQVYESFELREKLEKLLWRRILSSVRMP